VTVLLYWSSLQCATTRENFSASPSKLPDPMQIRRVFPLVAAAAVVAACSSDVTAPTSADNAALILHFDSLKNSSSGFGPIVYAQFVELLAEGAPVQTGTITIDGTPKRVKVMAIRVVEVSDGSPVDSIYAVAAWAGDGSDTAITFVSSGTTVGAFAAIGDTQGTGDGGTASVTPGALGASCTTFTPPSDIDLPPTISCNLQSSVASFLVSINGDGPTVGLPQQAIKGVRAELEVPPPPPPPC
jgi:hypothetical protein